MEEEEAAVRALLDRAHVLGSDPRVTNYAGGNVSAKATIADPATGDPVEVLWVKASGGDLGTLTAGGLAALTLSRVRSLRDRYAGEQAEDGMVPLFDHCRFGPGRAEPSIDTAMHAFVPRAHVDHLHPDAVIALATAVDGEALTKECFGGEVGWLPWRRPGFELGLQHADLLSARPGLRGVVLGGHGLTAWADTSVACQETSLDIIRTAERFIAERGRPDPFGPVVEGRRPLPVAERRRVAAGLGPVIRGLCSTDWRVVGRFTDSDVVLDFLSRESAPRLVGLGTSCPDHFLRTKVRPLLVDAPDLEVLRRAHETYREEYAAYYERWATPDSPPMRGADPAIVLVPGIGMWSFGPDAQTARVAGEFYVNAINVMHGAEALSTYQPIDEAEKFRIEYWSLEERKLRSRPAPRALTGRVAFVTGAGSGIGRATALRLAGAGAAVVVADLDATAAAGTVAEIGGPDDGLALTVDVADEASVAAAVDEACLAYGGLDVVVNNAGLSVSKPLAETTVGDWDRVHAVLARGSFLVSRAAAAVLVAQGTGGDIVYVVSKNAVVAGPDNVAYAAAKAGQAHQVRVLAAELGAAGIRVNGVSPDAVVRGSGIFASGWGAERAKVYGVPEEELGAFYAGRTLLRREILPEHVAAAIFTLVGGDLPVTTGTIIPVDGGVPAAFLR